MKIAINSSPLVFLVKLQFLELFLDTNDEFYIPPSVVEEIQAKDDEVMRTIAPFIEAEKLLVQKTNLRSLCDQLNLRLGRGESETISLATELQVDYTILDDLAARKMALNLGLNVKGTLAVIRKLSKEGKIDIGDKKEFYQRLVDINFRISRSVFNSIFLD